MSSHIDALIRAVLEKVKVYLREEFTVDLRTQTVGRLPASHLPPRVAVGTSIPPPFVYVVDSDGAYVVDSDGAYVYEAL